MKKALITGITGQDGSYLAELLLSKGYDVYGLVRRTSNAVNKYERISDILDKITLVDGDMIDDGSLRLCLDQVQPDEIYNLAAQSYVGTSWTQPITTCDINGLGTIRLLEAAKQVCPWTRFYQASSSEMYGKVQSSIQDEQTPFHPRSPYGYSKLMAYWAAVNYRESYGMHVSNGILFNHESPRRGKEFVTRKISMGVAKIYHFCMNSIFGSNVKISEAPKIHLGNLQAERDWGFAGDYVKAMWLILQQDTPDDYVIATGRKYTVEYFCQVAFSVIGIVNWEDFVTVDEKNLRPADVNMLCGDATKAKEKLGWAPETLFSEMVRLMVEHDIAQPYYT